MMIKHVYINKVIINGFQLPVATYVRIYSNLKPKMYVATYVCMCICRYVHAHIAIGIMHIHTTYTVTYVCTDTYVQYNITLLIL